MKQEQEDMPSENRRVCGGVRVCECMEACVCVTHFKTKADCFVSSVRYQLV